MNHDLLAKVYNLYELYHSGAIPTLVEHEVNPGLEKESRLNYIYFTLPVCLNFQRSSPAMWKSALATFNDPETNYLFYPEKVVLRPREIIQQDLFKHKLSLQFNKHTDIWIAISKALNTYFKDDPREVLRAGDFDILKILNILQKQYKDDFPYLRGPKLSNYWLYILTHFTDVQFSNMHKLSIIPDTHVIKSSKYLGLVDEEVDALKVANAWAELLEGKKISPVDMHAVLWNWSRNNFQPAV